MSMYQLYKLRRLGLKALILEAGTGVGGTWYWNRYPGARFDPGVILMDIRFPKNFG